MLPLPSYMFCHLAIKAASSQLVPCVSDKPHNLLI